MFSYIMEYSCIKCNFETGRIDNYRRHQQSNKHIEAMKNTNIVISHDYSTDATTNEVDVNTIVENKVHYCFKCEKQYKGLKYLEEHKKKCNGVDAMTCPICMKTFKHLQNKSRHMKDNKCKPSDVQQMDNCLNQGYIYLLHERYFVERGEPVFKIDKSKRMNISSLSTRSVIELFYHCKDCDKIEKAVINRFQNWFEPMTSLGPNYFKGNVTDMIEFIMTYTAKVNKGWKG